jgi:hypothetical protein
MGCGSPAESILIGSDSNLADGAESQAANAMDFGLGLIVKSNT